MKPSQLHCFLCTLASINCNYLAIKYESVWSVFIAFVCVYVILGGEIFVRVYSHSPFRVPCFIEASWTQQQKFLNKLFLIPGAKLHALSSSKNHYVNEISIGIIVCVIIHGQSIVCAYHPLTNHRTAPKVDYLQATRWLVNGRQAQAKACSCRRPVNDSASCSIIFLIHCIIILIYSSQYRW